MVFISAGTRPADINWMEQKTMARVSRYLSGFPYQQNTIHWIISGIMKLRLLIYNVRAIKWPSFFVANLIIFSYKLTLHICYVNFIANLFFWFKRNDFFFFFWSSISTQFESCIFAFGSPVASASFQIILHNLCKPLECDILMQISRARTWSEFCDIKT